MADILTDEQVKEMEVAARCGEHTRPFDVLNLIATLRHVQAENVGCRNANSRLHQTAHRYLDKISELKQENARLRETLDIRESVREFALDMERTLKANDHKGGWEQCDPRWLFDRLREEVAELAIELHRSCSCRESDCPHVLMTTWDLANKQRVLSEAADVANFAMMIDDRARQAIATEGEGKG